MKLKRMASVGVIPALIAALAALPGCGGYSGADLCDDRCDCEGCSDVEYADCVDTAEDLERNVENEGCGDFYDDYMACNEGEFACVAGKVDLDGCEDELGRVLSCVL